MKKEMRLVFKGRFRILRYFFAAILLSGLAAGYPSYAQQEETLTISTYYPSPYGVYKVLTLYPLSDIGPDTCLEKDEGAMAYYQDIDPNKSQLIVCKRTGSNVYQWKGLVAGAGGEGFWRKENDNLYPEEETLGLAIPTVLSTFKGKLHMRRMIFRQGDTFLNGRSTSGHNLGIDSTIGDTFGGIFGGENNEVQAWHSVISGGQDNLIGSTEELAFIAGGSGNIIGDNGFGGGQAGGASGVIWGGQNNNILSFPAVNQNTGYNVISGGMSNLLGGRFSVISGGEGNIASFIPLIFNNPTSWWTVVSGGQSNQALADYAVVTGGRNNLAEGRYSLVSGGEANQARGDYSWVGGRNMQLDPAADRTFAWGHSAIPHPIADNDAFIIYSDAAAFRVEIGNSSRVLPGTDLRIYNLTQGPGTDTLKYDFTIGQISHGSSSIRYKTNLRPIDNALAKVKQLRGVYFNWKESGKPGLGMIAEEVGEVIPEVVSYEENGQDARSLDYEKLVGLLVEAVKEQEKRIADLRKGVEALKARK